MVKTILVPTDGSKNSRVAIQQAIDLAGPLNATIHALAVTSQFASETTQDQLRNEPAGRSETAIDEARDLVTQADIPFEGTIRKGIPHEEILQFADEQPFDMIVMGTHGRTGVKRVLIGSVAEKTVRNADVPVLTVPPVDE